MEVLTTHHVAIYTREQRRMEEFYTRTLGFAVTKRWDDANIIFIDIGSTTIELIGRPEIEGEPPALGTGAGLNHLALHVVNVDAAVQELAAKGVQVLKEPADFKDIRAAFFLDPDGNALELVQEM
ncbi:MAG: VOC family protein [Chloroflexota bacterium]|nr:VOC family protein [Chloroflexota bacterium]